jgi:acetyl esterase/lipase
MIRIPLLLCLFLTTITNHCFAQQKVIPLYEGKAPGSETWSWKEQVQDTTPFHHSIVYNVVQPTLTVFPAQGVKQTGTAVVIAPGGGFYFLSTGPEGNQVAEELSKKGITSFVLKYRLVRSKDPISEVMETVSSQAKFDSLVKPVLPLAMKDGLTAVAYVRRHAAEYNINPDRIGFMGFSAGGGVTMSVAYNCDQQSRPNFIAPIYAYNKGIIGSTVPTEKMPAFIVVASDDPLGLAPVSVNIYQKWIAARQPAELHVYQLGGHGFGMNRQGKASDTWIYRFEDWMKDNGLLQ